MKNWKNQCNRTLRNIPQEDEIPNGKFYIRMHDIWTSPSDGKTYHGNDPKYKRK